MPRTGESYHLPLNARSKRGDAIYIDHWARYAREQREAIRCGIQRLSWITRKEQVRINELLRSRDIFIHRDKWKELSTTDLLIAHLVARGINETLVRVWIWAAQNNFVRGIDNNAH
jgi:hypothetical protein